MPSIGTPISIFHICVPALWTAVRVSQPSQVTTTARDKGKRIKVVDGPEALVYLQVCQGRAEQVMGDTTGAS